MQQAEFNWGPKARAVIAAGPRVCETILLERLDELFEEHGRGVLSKPIRLVVPSKSLRLHVLERVLAHRGHAVAGLDCRTHHGLALAVTERAGANAAISTDLFPLFARRLAHRETPLRRTLDHLKDGYASILSSVGDLLDAGLDPAHLEALEEALEVEGTRVATPFEVERAKSLVRVAVGTTTALEEQELGRSSHLLQAATTLVKQSPELLPSSAILVHGYNDATGLVTDFLLALVQTFGGEILLDNPPDPVQPESSDTGVRFAEVYRERVEAALGFEPAVAELPVSDGSDGSDGSDTSESTGASEPNEAPCLEMFRALGGEAEVREVARRVRALLECGVRAERIGVVTRRLGNYTRAIRKHFDRLGVPFSGVAHSGPKKPDAFRVSALLEILKQHEQVPVERWLDASRIDPGLRNDLELGFHALGIARLVEAGNLEVRRFVGGAGKGLRLPVRAGFESGDGEPRVTYRYLSTQQMETATAAARRLKEHLVLWSEAGELEEHLRSLDTLIDDHLGWIADSELPQAFRAEVDGWSQGIRGDIKLDFHEFANLLSYRLEDFGASALGGRGGGVQVLDVVEARSRTFEHLFLLGLNRGVFPRVIQEDALLPDRLREVLSHHGFGVLPDLHRKLPGFEEERYLFAQLLVSSPNIVVSWLEVDDEHVFRTPSPLIERLRWSHENPPDSWTTPPTAPPLFSEPEPPSKGSAPQLRPAVESATIAGIFGSREQFSAVLEAAERENQERFPNAPPPQGQADAKGPPDSDPPTVLAPIRLRVLNEFDPVRGSRSGEPVFSSLGPYFGFVGPPSEESDPRMRERLFVTTLESIARCPWRTFVERVLRVEKLPDPLDVLPGVNPLLIGNLVHSVLETIVDAGIDKPIEDLARARTAEGDRIAWPDAKEFERILENSARKVAFDQGITLPGFDRVLAGVCRPHLEAARGLDWIENESRFEVLASEEYGQITWEDPPATIGFKADRVDRNEDRLLFTDYKTGKGLGGDSQYRKKDRQLLLQGVLAGERLQAALYARAGGGQQDVGRYAFLNPSLDPDRDREVMVRANDEEIGALMDRAVSATLSAWQAGAFFPRLAQHHQNVEPVTCSYCSVAEACLRGDSSSRGRLRSWAELRHPRRRDSRAEAGPGEIPRPILEDAHEAAPNSAVVRTWYLADAAAFPPKSEPPKAESK